MNTVSTNPCATCGFSPEQYKLTIARQNDEIERLKQAIRVLISNNNRSGAPSSIEDPGIASTPTSTPAPSDSSLAKHSSNPEDGNDCDSNTNFCLDPIYDKFEGLYFCAICLCEIDDGVCIRCGTEYDLDMSLDEEYQKASEAVDNQGDHEDRTQKPRGTTPLRDIPPSQKQVPEEYRRERRRREWEYFELIQRGATHIMCETFHLEFKSDLGIIAWADEYLYEHFAGRKMQVGDFWKIYLGRRVRLDDGDLDGTDFIEGLLEDAFLFSGSRSNWETIEETPGVWASRLVVSERSPNAEDTVPLPDNSAEAAPSATQHCEEAINSNLYYEFSDCESVSDAEIAHPSWAWMAERPSFNSDLEMNELADSDEDEDDNINDFNSDDITTADEEAMSSCDSDFDSDEELSGDEVIMRGSRTTAV